MQAVRHLHLSPLPLWQGRGLAAPVFDYEGIVRAANLVVTRSLVSVAELCNVYTPMLVETAEEISEALGHY